MSITLQLRNNINKLYYDNTDFSAMNFLGVPIQKNPADLWVYQEILFEVKPELIIEFGTAAGGTTLYLASILDLLKNGKVISIDIEDKDRPKHKRIIYMNGDCISKSLYDELSLKIEQLSPKSILIILDTLHDYDHVNKQLELYSKYVTIGSYIIVEDTNLYGNPVRPIQNELGASVAVNQFLGQTDSNFISDRSREKFIITFNPGGYLKRIK